MKKIRMSSKTQNVVWRVLPFLSMAMFIFFVALFISCDSKAQATPQQSQEHAIIFEFSNMDSCAYVWDDGCFLIWYDDADAFDYDAMAWRSGRESWYGEFVYLDIEDSLVGEFLQDFHKYTELRSDYKSNWEQIDELSQHWGIVNWDKSSESYELVRMEGDWWYR